MEYPKHILAYSYYANWSEEDQLWIGRVEEFPSLAAHGNTEQEALGEITFVVNAVVRGLVASGESVPVPKGEIR